MILISTNAYSQKRVIIGIGIGIGGASKDSISENISSSMVYFNPKIAISSNKIIGTINYEAMIGKNDGFSGPSILIGIITKSKNIFGSANLGISYKNNDRQKFNAILDDYEDISKKYIGIPLNLNVYVSFGKFALGVEFKIEKIIGDRIVGGFLINTSLSDYY